MKIGIRQAFTVVLVLAAAPTGVAQKPPPSGPASALLAQAQAQRVRGEYTSAERLYKEVLKERKALGPEDTVAAYKGLALTYQAMQRPQEAFLELRSAMAFEQELMTTAVERGRSSSHPDKFTSHETLMRNYAANSLESLELFVSLVAETLKLPEARRPLTKRLNPKETSPSIQRIAFAWTLERKGLVLDTLARMRWMGEADPASIGRIRGLRAKLSELALNPPPKLNAAERAKQRAKLQNDLEIEEDIIARENWGNPRNPLALSGPLQVGDRYRYSGEDEIDRMHAMIPPLPNGAVLVEFLRARVFDFHATSASRAWKAPHYFGFVVGAGRDGTVEMFDLGDAGAIDSAVKNLRRNILDFTNAYVRGAVGADYEKQKEAEYRECARKLYELVFAPLRKAVGPARLVYVAPDSELNRVSFEALGSVKGDGQFGYLIKDYRFVYLATGRDLAPKSDDAGLGTAVFADPDYDLGFESREQLVTSLRGSQPKGKTPGGMADFVHDTVVYQPWSPLHASALEAKLVRDELQGTVYGPVRQYQGDQALQERLLGLQSPRILHIATHGFFLPAAGGMDDPLLRSGILLAGANTLGKGRSASERNVASGWVTAEEIMAMDLHGTELVVLSGCDTGLGDIQTGEGVFGLRRAFQYAGARRLLVSLYKVPDDDTVQLMTKLYGSLKTGARVRDAFHEAQLAVLDSRRAKAGAAHPFYWASFVLVGDVIPER